MVGLVCSGGLVALVGFVRLVGCQVKNFAESIETLSELIFDSMSM
jgi:hypothetical protein